MNLNRDEVFGHDIIGDEAATPWLKKNPCEMSMVLANASDTTGPDTRDRHQKPAPHHCEHVQNRLVQRRRIPRTVYASRQQRLDDLLEIDQPCCRPASGYAPRI